MGKARTFQTSGFKSTNTTFRAYVQDDATGINIVPNTVSGITYTVTQALGPHQGTAYGSAVALSPVASYLFASLSVVGWTEDATGWNFLATLPASCFPDAGQYLVEFIGTLASDGSTFPIAICDHHAWSK